MASRIRNVAAALALAACSACAVPQPGSLTQAASACANGASHVEVQSTGVVARVLGTRDSRSGMHEGFLLRTGGRTILVEDNVDITGPVPLQTGDSVRLRGQYECDDDVIHWTHRDPRGRHRSGYIEVDGRRYQ